MTHSWTFMTETKQLALHFSTMKHIIPFILLVFSISIFSCSAAKSNIHHLSTALTDSIMPEDSVETDTVADLTTAQMSLPERMQELLKNDIFERTQVGLYVYDLTADTLVFAYNERQCMRPASNQKMLTAITALRDLGTDYQFKTRLYADPLPADTDSIFTGHIYIKAGFDPLFAAEDMQAFADSLRAINVKRITSPIHLDLSFKDEKRFGWGWCWDDDLTPLTPLLYNNHDRFVDQLRNALRHNDIEWDGTTDEKLVPTRAHLLCMRSHNIDQVLLPMMKHSDNTMAESVFYQLAAQGGKVRAGRKQATTHYKNLYRTLGLNPDHYQVADGSGLSLYNYVTPELLGKALRYAYQHTDIYRHLLPTLPEAAHDGTLRKRMKGSKAAYNVHAKTGTVEGVSTLSGYCTAANGNTLCFAIMNQGVRYTSTGRNFQDRVCKALCK